MVKNLPKFRRRSQISAHDTIIVSERRVDVIEDDAGERERGKTWRNGMILGVFMCVVEIEVLLRSVIIQSRLLWVKRRVVCC